MTDCVTKATCRAAETRDTAVWDAGNRHADSWDGARRFMSSPWLLALGLIAAGTMARLAFRDLPNFAPVAALALFAGYYFRSAWIALCVPLGVMAASDLVLGGYHPLMMAVVYGMLAAPVALRTPLRRWLKIEQGRPLAASLSASGLVGCSLASSVMFFVVTNFACWLTMEFYAKTGAGLLQCYIQALPFFRYTLIGDLVFSVGLFAAYTLAVSLGWSRATRSVAVATAAVNR
jgi:hypothetical protein